MLIKAPETHEVPFMPDDRRSRGGKIGGRVRALNLTPEERTRIARQGAATRWGYRATHKGNFKDDFGIDADCYVLNDEHKTAVISQSDMGASIGLIRRGSSLPDFFKGEKIAPFLGGVLREKFENPIKFQWRSAAAYGFNIELLIDICDAVIKADSAGVFTRKQAHIVRQASVIRNASAKQGIKTLAWAVAGYDPAKEEVINAFKDYIAKEACEYAKEFPRQLYEGWCRIYKLREVKISEKFSFWPRQFKKLTLDQVYHPLAGSDGAIKELVLRARSEEETKGKRLFQFLSEEMGKTALRIQLGKLLAIMDLSDTQEEYENNFNKVFKGIKQ